MQVARFSVRIVLWMLICALVGCGEETGGKLAVSGLIKLKGQPLDAGSIQFESKPPAPSCFTGGEIKDGKYAIPPGQGLLPGTYTVRISAPENVAAPSEPGGEIAPPVKDRVPPEYNVNTTLTFEAKSGTSNTYDFEVP
ncbi:MAG: hypothetical protein L0211_07885 [Planctomycetaceae bacterium]|nr:hypothetical protein [Planctomycetaceae bacterium]